MQIKIPVQNNVEVIIGDMFIKVDARVNPISPPMTTEGKIALEQFNSYLSANIHQAVYKAMEDANQRKEKGG